MELTDLRTRQPSVNVARATRDMTRCIQCERKFASDELRSSVYIESTLTPIGAIHEECYNLMLERWYNHRRDQLDLGDTEFRP